MARGKEATTHKTGVAGWNESEGTGRDSRANRGKRLAQDRRRRVAVVAFVVICCVLSVVCAWPIQERITRGLWFKGGTAQTMTADKDLSADEQSKAVATIRDRLGNVGVSEYLADPSGSNGVVIKLPWNVEGKRIAESVGGAGKLEFVRVDDIGDADALSLLNAGSKDATLKDGTYTAFLNNDNVTSCDVVMVTEGIYAVTINFDDEGAKKFADVTEELAKEYGSIAIVIDGNVISAPNVSEKIDGGQVSISGGFSEAEARALKAVLDSEVLPTNLKLTDSTEIGAVAGDKAAVMLAGAAAVAIIVIAVIAFMRMKKTGLLVLGSEVVEGILMIGLMAVVSRIEVFVLTMPSLVGGVFACAGGVVAAWAVAARFQELARLGKSVRGSSLSAVSDALNPMALPLMGIVVVSLVLLFLPFAQLREFGLGIVLGAIASTMAVLLFEVPLMRVMAVGSMQEDPAAWGLEASASEGEDSKAEES